MPRMPAEFATHPLPFPTPTVYRAHCRVVIDGDTVDLLVDCGFLSYEYASIRLKDIDTPEIRGVDAETRALGIAARDALAALIEGKPVMLRSWQHLRTFTRWVGEVLYFEDGVWKDAGQTLVDGGYAVRVPMKLGR